MFPQTGTGRLPLMKSSAGLFALLAATAFSAGQDLFLKNLPTLRDFASHRITSADPTGRNEDWRFLEPGGTLVLADIQGPDCITHFRDNRAAASAL